MSIALPPFPAVLKAAVAFVFVAAVAQAQPAGGFDPCGTPPRPWWCDTGTLAGTPGELQVSKDLFEYDSGLREEFGRQEKAIKDGLKDYERCKLRTAERPREWDRCRNHLESVIRAQTEFGGELRSFATSRQADLGRILENEGIQALKDEMSSALRQSEVNLAAISDVRAQLGQQRAAIESGETPTVTWPPGIDPRLQKQINDALARAVELRDPGFLEPVLATLAQFVYYELARKKQLFLEQGGRIDEQQARAEKLAAMIVNAEVSAFGVEELVRLNLFELHILDKLPRLSGGDHD